MDDIPARVRRFLVEHHLFRPDALLVVAVSGGPDSLCLLHALHGLIAAGGPGLHVAHLDHRFRGAESAADAAFVAATAAALGLPATIAQRDVARLGYGRNRLAAARAARYAFLREVAHRIGAQAVATGHQLDDQAETVLLHLLRGAGPAGLRGMLPLRHKAQGTGQHLSALAPISDDEPRAAFCLVPFPLIVRPLLTTLRAEIDAYCRAQGLQPRDDPSNRAERYARSRLRQTLVPALQRENPQILAALGRTAQICADDYDFIQGQLDRAWPALAEERRGLSEPGVADEGPGSDAPRPAAPASAVAPLNSDSILLRAGAWATLHPSLQRYALRRAVALLDPGYEPSYQQVETARALDAAGAQADHTGSHQAARAPEPPVETPARAVPAPSSRPAPARVALGPRLLAEARPAGLLIRRRDAPIGTDLPQLGEDLPVRLPPLPRRPAAGESGAGGEGAGRLPIASGWSMVIQPSPPDQPSRWWVQLDRAALGEGLLWRRRRAGDRFRPAGGRGSRKLQDFFVDVKLPQRLRDAWPILAAEGAIVWVAGLRADARFVAGPASRDTIWVGLIRE